MTQLTDRAIRPLSVGVAALLQGTNLAIFTGRHPAIVGQTKFCQYLLVKLINDTANRYKKNTDRLRTLLRKKQFVAVKFLGIVQDISD